MLAIFHQKESKMKKYFIPIYVVLFLIGATALWYFGHHRPAQKILKAEPKKIYKSIPLPPKRSSVKPAPSETIQVPRDGNATVKTEGAETKTAETDNVTTSEKKSSEQEQFKGTSSNQLGLQEDFSDDDPAAAEAFDKYITAESEYQAAFEIFKEALISQDYERIKSATDSAKEAEQRRKEALQNLAPYSEAAVKMLEEMAENEKIAEEMIAEFTAESKAEMQEMSELIEKAQSMIRDGSSKR